VERFGMAAVRAKVFLMSKCPLGGAIPRRKRSRRSVKFVIAAISPTACYQ
jgi:hypothetical protein